MSVDALLIRADASVTIGTGHVMRCLALAQAWQDAGGRAVFAMTESTSAIQSRLKAESCEIQNISSTAGTMDDAAEAIAMAREQIPDWAVVDGYQFGDEYQAVLKASGLKVLFIDDNGHAGRYSANVVLDQNVSASEQLYENRQTSTKLLLGPRYSLLRREFLAWSDWERPISDSFRNLLVMMGGSDPANVTARILEAMELANLPEVETTVVVGGSNPHFETLQKLASRSSLRIKLLRDVSNLAELMSQADVAISAAGSSCWELCFMGLPSLLLDIADNQTPIARELDRRGCARHVGNKAFLTETLVQELQKVGNSSELRRSLSKASRQLVDGHGAQRVVAFLLGKGRLRLRPVRVEDRRLLWNWANDPAGRAASFTTEEIPWDDHCSWFSQKLNDDGCVMLLAEDEGGTPCGQIRFDRKGDGDWEVDVGIAKEQRGRGLASLLIELGVQAIRNEHREARVHAFVKPSNPASVKAFERANFRQVGPEKIHDNLAIHLVSKPDDSVNS